MRTRRRLLARLAGSVALGFPAAGSIAQTAQGAFPARPVRVLTSGVVGGLTDSTARIAAERLASSTESRGQPFVIDNRPGAGGVISMLGLLKSVADGYTVKFADAGATSIAPALHSKPPYQTLRDFTPLCLVGTTPLFFAVSSSLNVSTFEDFVSLLRSRPGSVSYGSSGVGSIHHLATETIAQQLGLSMVHVAYKGSSQSTPALVAGEIQALFGTIAQLAPHARTGRVRLLAVASPERTPQARDVPSFVELGWKGFVFVPTVGVLAPAGLPRPLVDWWGAALQKALRHPESIARYERIGIDVVASSPAQYRQWLEADLATYAKAVRLSGAKVD
jgi:tripartite-type tricarboxylate transporter receptor subunit TctC